MEGHEQYFVGVIQQDDWDRGEREYRSAFCWYPGAKLGQKYVRSLDKARDVLNHAYKLWNGTKVYNEKGERYETDAVAPGMGVTLVCTKETDARLRIVKHCIQKRFVTEWETVEEG